MLNPETERRLTTPRKFFGTTMASPLGCMVIFCFTCLSTVAGTDVSIEFSDQEAFDRAFASLKSNGEVSERFSTITSGETTLDKSGKGTRSYILKPSGDDDLKGPTTTPLQVVGNFRIVGEWHVASFGLWVGVNAEKSNGWLGLVNLISPGEVRLRIFGRGSDPGSGKLGTVLVDKTLNVSLPLDKGRFLAARFLLSREPNGQTLALALLAEGSEEVIAEVTTEDSADPADLPGLAGARCAGERVLWKSFRTSYPARDDKSAK